MENEILIPEEYIEGNALENQEEVISEEEVVEEAEIPEEKPEERTVPLSALHKEREEKKKYRDEVQKLRLLTDRLMAATNSSTPEEVLSRMDSIELSARMRERGVDEATARDMLRMEEENRNLKKREAAQQFDRDVQDLSQNPLYSDILDVRDEVEEYARNKGISVKEAYNALFAEQRTSRLQEEARRNAIEQNANKQSKRIKGLTQAGNGNGAGGESLGLTAQELEICKAAGISPTEYAKYKK